MTLIKNIWANRRYRALVIMVFYIIFFLFIFLFISIDRNPKLELTGLDLFETVTKYNITKDKELDPLSKLNPRDIYKLIKLSTLESTNYLSKSNTYIIYPNNFNENLNINLQINNDVKIITYEVDNKITRVEILIDNYILKMEVEY